MYSDIRKYSSSFWECLKASIIYHTHEIQAIHIKMALKTLAIDILVFKYSNLCYKYIIFVQEIFIKFLETLPVKNQTAEIVVIN